MRAEAASRAATAARLAFAIADRVGSVGVIVPPGFVDETRDALAATGREFADAEARGLGEGVSLVPVGRCKGLEFDGVVLVEPGAVVDEGGLRLLYVALTRAMRWLAVVHSGDLPDALRTTA